jgi:integrase
MTSPTTSSSTVFGTVDGKPLAERNVRRALEAAKAKAELDQHEDRVSLHALRHSFLSHAATMLDVPDTTLARMAGHANPAITMRLYARDRRDQERVNEDFWLGRRLRVSAETRTSEIAEGARQLSLFTTTQLD